MYQGSPPALGKAIFPGLSPPQDSIGWDVLVSCFCFVCVCVGGDISWMLFFAMYESS